MNTHSRRLTTSFSYPTLFALAAILALGVGVGAPRLIDARQPRVTQAERPAVAAAPAAVGRFAPTSSAWEQTVGYDQLDRLAPASSSCLFDNPRCQEPAPPTAPSGR